MTFVNWPDKDLRPVDDSVSFGTDKIASDLQLNRKKSVPTWSASVWPDADIWTRSLISIEFVNNKTKNEKQSLTESLTKFKISTGMFGAIDEIFHNHHFISTDGIYTIPS